jgi:hypothetical protein
MLFIDKRGESVYGSSNETNSRDMILNIRGSQLGLPDADADGAFSLFEDRIQENGFTIVRGVYNDDEDWVDPCVTTTLLG